MRIQCTMIVPDLQDFLFTLFRKNKNQPFLNRITIENIEKDKSPFGALLGTWVYGELLKTISLANDSWNIYYYRDKDKTEVDFVLENYAHQIIGIEVKASSTLFN